MDIPIEFERVKTLPESKRNLGNFGSSWRMKFCLIYKNEKPVKDQSLRNGFNPDWSRTQFSGAACPTSFISDLFKLARYKDFT